MTRLDREVDRQIADLNRRFLNDPQAIADAQADGERWRLQLEAEGILPPLNDPMDEAKRLEWLNDDERHATWRDVEVEVS